MSQNLTERNNRQAILISESLLDIIILVIEMRCKINSITHINMINRLYTRHKYTHYSHPVRLHKYTHTPYYRLPHNHTHTYIHPPWYLSLSHTGTHARAHKCTLAHAHN